LESFSSSKYKIAVFLDSDAGIKSFSDYLNDFRIRYILIDSKEVYEYDDAICSYVSSALIDCALDIYTLSNKTNIHAKVAFASEMYPHLKQDNREKTLGKSLFIMWRYKDILTFIAKRYCNTLKKEGVSVESYNLNKIEEAKAFLAIYFPEAISSYSKINFETISYIIGHTQKKPRQIIQLFNIILNLAKKNGIEYSKLTPTCIREGCNVKLDLLCGGTLDLYSNLFRSGDEIIRKTFTRSNNILSLSDIHKRLKESSGIMQRANVDKERAIRLFLESGLLGRLKAEHPIKRYQNKYIITAEFEYQIKEILTITNNDVLVIHPMFYQPLGILADNNSLVYPYPTDEESEELSLLHSYLNS